MLQKGSRENTIVIKVSENNEYPVLDNEIRKKKSIHVPLKYVDEDVAKSIEEQIEREQKETKKEEPIKHPFRFAGYDPNVVDFLRRCGTKVQAKEIIDFMEKKGEINKEDAKKIRKQLTKEGLRSFGTKKEKDHYFRT